MRVLLLWLWLSESGLYRFEGPVVRVGGIEDRKMRLLGLFEGTCGGLIGASYGALEYDWIPDAGKAEGGSMVPPGLPWGQWCRVFGHFEGVRMGEEAPAMIFFATFLETAGVVVQLGMSCTKQGNWSLQLSVLE